MLTVYRTVKTKYAAEPLSTEGARLYGGRWNPKGYPLLYATSSPALALVESLVHLPRVPYGQLPQMILCTIAIESIKYNEVITYPPDKLPDYWHEPSYERTQWILKDWLDVPTGLVVAVPSVVVPMSFNYLIHPAHPAFGTVRMVKQELFPVEPRRWPLPDVPSASA